MTAAELEAAGLYDPTAANAAERLVLLEWLVAHGATIERMVTAVRENALAALAADLQLRPGPRFTAHEIARRHGLSLELVLGLNLAMGFPPRDADEPIFSNDDAVTFAAFRFASGLFGEDATRRFLRVVGSSMARVAEAAVSLFQVNVEGPLRASGGTDLDVAKENMRATSSLGQVREMLQALFGAHMELAIRRLRSARPRRSVDTVDLTVGFVDLVGFTALTHHMTPAELARVIERFEETAYDVATARDGRVVKLIGDEVMFVTRDAAAACDIALTLFERFAHDAAVTPRGGLAVGELLVRGGDYYGPVVNLASRVADLAVPNEILVTPELAAAARTPSLRFVPAGKRMLKGFEEPVALLAVERAPGPG
jgi:adenylate cyclase